MMLRLEKGVSYRPGNRLDNPLDNPTRALQRLRLNLPVMHRQEKSGQLSMATGMMRRRPEPCLPGTVRDHRPEWARPACMK